MKTSLTRREFVASTSLAATGLALGLGPRAYAQSRGANEKVVLGMIGCGLRGGSDLDHAAFDAFRRAFAAAKCEISVAPEKISVRAPAVEKGRLIAVAAAAPWLKPDVLEPAASSANLEIDGVDVGQKYFAAAR